MTMGEFKMKPLLLETLPIDFIGILMIQKHTSSSMQTIYGYKSENQIFD